MLLRAWLRCFCIVSLVVVQVALPGGEVSGQCNAINFKANVTGGCPLLVAHFSASGTSTSAGSKFLWDFGNGYVSGNDTITKAFAISGKYTVKLQVTLPGANNACQALVKDTYITVYPIPTPVITADPGFIDCYGSSVTFTDSTVGTVSRNWVINGAKDTSRSFRVSFPGGASNPAINLFSTNKYGCQGYASKIEQIDEPPKGLDMCDTFTVRPSNIVGSFIPQLIPGNRAIKSYLWSFPGAIPSTSTKKSPTGITYTNLSQQFDVSVRVTTDDGCTYSLTRNKIVTNFLNLAFDSLCAGNTYLVQLRESASNTQYNFPAGIYDQLASSLTYKYLGNFSALVGFEVVPRSCMVWVNYPFFVHVKGPSVSFKSNDNQICHSNDTVHFINTTDTTNTPNPVFTWYIFDSTDKKLLTKNYELGPTSGFDTMYIPGRFGKFGVSLVATSSNGCKDSENALNFIVSANPKSNFDSIAHAGCYGYKIKLVSNPDPSEGPQVNYKYLWHVYNEKTPATFDSSAFSDFDFNPDSLGVYDVKLSISNGHCSNDTTKKAVFKILGDLTHVIVGNNIGCLNPVFSTTVGVGHEEKYPDDPNHPPLYHWYVEGKDAPYVHFGDTTASHTTVTINKSGCYGIYLRITTILDSDTCIYSYPPELGAPPVICVGPALSYNVNGLQCPGDTISVENYSPNSDFGFKWKVIPTGYADILPSDTSRNVKIIFKADTCYYVILTGSNNLSGSVCTQSDTTGPMCFHLPRPDFSTTTPTLYCAPAIGSFVNKTKNPFEALHYIWNFDDGTTFELDEPTKVSHVYNSFKKATYNVSLTTISSAGCTQTVTKPGTINITGPVPFFKIDKKSGCDSVEVYFTNLSHNVHKFYFFYDDKTPYDSVSPNSHLYSIGDTSIDSVIYNPTLQSLDDTACPAFYQDTIKIYKSPSGVKIKTDVSAGCVPLTIHFQADTESATTWKWDFNGDGIIDDSTHLDTFYTYTKPGKYVASLAMTNHLHCPVTVFSKPINAAPNAIAGFKPSETSFCGSDDISFLNTSKNSVNFVFKYGDASPDDTNTIAAHRYFYDTNKDTGAVVYFHPTLIAFNSAGCANTFKTTITAYRMPVAGFTYSSVTGCNPLNVNFIDTSKYSFATEWDFDNNGTLDAFGKKVNHVFGTGIYSVKMLAFSDQGCVDSVEKINLVGVNPIPEADFSVSDTDVCYMDKVHFKNLTQPADPLMQWSWKFNDPAAPFDTSSEKDPAFIFYTKGLHTIILSAVDSKGCSNTISKKTVFVEDTIPPDNTVLNYVSVLNKDSILINYQKSRIRIFKSYIISRYDKGVLTGSDTVNDVNDTAIMYCNAFINTSDSSYCLTIQTINECGKISAIGQEHCTILLKGNAMSGAVNTLTWTAYQGWVPQYYRIYRAGADGIYKLLDSVRGDVFFYADSALCDETYCYNLQGVNKINGFVSNSNRICLKAVYVHDHTPLNLRYATVVNNNAVMLKWDSVRYKQLIGYQVDKFSSKSGWDDNYAVTGFNSFIDNNTRVNDSSYIFRIHSIDKCGYTGPESNIGTSILLEQNVANDKVYLKWNSYRNWPAGVQNYLVQVRLKTNKYKDVANVPGTDTTYQDDSVYNAVDTAYCYRVIAIENGPNQDSSVSNLTCAVLPSRVFIPNAFSPNADNLNDVWKVSSVSIYNLIGNKVKQFDMKVYNKWGTLVFETNDLNKGWDGTFNGAKAPADVYIYLISAEGVDRKSFHLDGNVTLIR